MESKNKKIIALLPVKNESWILPTYLSSMTKFADEIIALDDNSTDNSVKILEEYGVKTITPPQSEKINMSEKRNLLLKAGRESAGTHFIWLDADEIFSNDFIKNNGKEKILNLNPGEKLSIRWIHLWKSTKEYLDDKKSPFGYIWKDFIVCDNENLDFENKALSENRTPGNNSKMKKLKEKEGVVIHFQFSNWNKVQFKQAWYRCIELLELKKDPRKINNTYSVTLDRKNLNIEPVPEKWSKNVKPHEETDAIWHFDAILNLFDKHGIQFFESLDIWHIKELKERFVKQTGREPIPQKYPNWLIKLNNIKNKLKNSL